jgi:hypothetical protein
MKEVQLNISGKASILLQQCLASTGWSKTDNYIKSARYILTAGKLISEVFKSDADIATIMGDFEFETCQTAVRHHLQEGNFPGTPPAAELVEALKLT